jgi:hypothetical protein
MNNTTVKTPWKDYMGDVPMALDYFTGTMFAGFEQAANARPDGIALDFMGKSTTYRQLAAQIRLCAQALQAMGLQEGDKVKMQKGAPNAKTGEPFKPWVYDSTLYVRRFEKNDVVLVSTKATGEQYTGRVHKQYLTKI